eukprot:6433240-Amphidinium_carterae.1
MLPPANFQDDDLPDFDAIDREELAHGQENPEVLPNLPAGEAPTAISQVDDTMAHLGAQGVFEDPAQPQTGEVPTADAPPEQVQESAAAAPTEDPSRYTRMLPTVLGGTATYVGGRAPGFFPDDALADHLDLPPEALDQLQSLREQVASIVRTHQRRSTSAD